MTATSEGRLGPPAPIRERDHDRPASLDNPRSPRRTSAMPNFEKRKASCLRGSGIGCHLLQRDLVAISMRAISQRGIANDDWGCGIHMVL